MDHRSKGPHTRTPKVCRMIALCMGFGPLFYLLLGGLGSSCWSQGEISSAGFQGLSLCPTGTALPNSHSSPALKKNAKPKSLDSLDPETLNPHAKAQKSPKAIYSMVLGPKSLNI